MGYFCFYCKKDLEISVDGRIGRSTECPHCKSDAHVCLNCQHYDAKAYNQCHEPQAERVLDKNRRNFCDFFKPSTEPQKATTTQKNTSALDDLFKK